MAYMGDSSSNWELIVYIFKKYKDSPKLTALILSKKATHVSYGDALGRQSPSITFGELP